MARPKKQLKAKQPIRLRMKSLANGNQSLYLDIYKDGKRVYQFLKLYLIPETSQAAKVANQNTLQAAEAIKAQRMLELTNDEAGISKVSTRSNIRVTDLTNQYCELVKRRNPQSSYSQHLESLRCRLEDYNPTATLRNINKDFCKDFITFLLQSKSPKTGKPMNQATAATYLRMFNTVINYAVKNEMIRENPLERVPNEDKPHGQASMREYLTIEELRELIALPCKPNTENAKRAFIFCCFCGLRFSDMAALTWGCISTTNGQAAARIIVRKTRTPLYVPLSDEALRWMPERGDADDTARVFPLAGYNVELQRLTKWVASSSINKRVTFHIARHTFATLMLTLGGDLYTVSKLLGHSKVNTTEIYAKIVDAKKIEAVNLVNGVFDK